MDLNVIKEDGGDDVDITPMIDVVFLLVIFFMVTSTFIEEAKVYKIELPKADQPETVSTDDTRMLTVTLDGKIYVKLGKGEIIVKDLQEAVDHFKLIHSDTQKILPVILRVDARCDYSQYVQAKNALRLAGVDMIFEEVEVGR